VPGFNLHSDWMITNRMKGTEKGENHDLTDPRMASCFVVCPQLQSSSQQARLDKVSSFIFLRIPQILKLIPCLKSPSLCPTQGKPQGGKQKIAERSASVPECYLLTHILPRVLGVMLFLSLEVYDPRAQSELVVSMGERG
jgi:hypothetical protein